MMKRVVLTSLTFMMLACQTEFQPQAEQNEESDFEKALADFPSIERIPKHKVLTLGVFHFDRSMDGSDVVAKNHIDIMSERNQEELNVLIEKLEQFNPTSIAVEWRPEYQAYMDSLYNEYQSGNYELGRNEAFQLGFRLANNLGHKRLFCIDNNPPIPEHLNEIEDWEAYADNLGHLELWQAYEDENSRYNMFIDTIQNHLYVKDYLRLINVKKNTERTKQLWTTGLVNVGHGDKYLGADLLGRWYTRNARLYANAKNLVSKKGENLLIIYGGAHKWILDELFESSPDFEVVHLDDLIKD